ADARRRRDHGRGEGCRGPAAQGGKLIFMAKKSELDRAAAINRIADDWLLVHPDMHKARLVEGLRSFDDEHLREVFSFHRRLYDSSVDERRRILRDLPSAFDKE